MNNLEKMKRQRKLLIMLPVLTIPFLTMIFWALGGGETEQALAGEQKQAGLLSILPSPKEEDEQMDKMAFYDQAGKDSIKLSEARKNDPYSHSLDGFAKGHLADEDMGGSYSARGGYNYSSVGGTTMSKEEQVSRRLAELQQALKQPEVQQQPRAYEYGRANDPAGMKSQDIDRLEAMMKTMTTGNGKDPEMLELNGVLDKILDIQDPARLRERKQQQSRQQLGQVFSVAPVKSKLKVSSLDGKQSALGREQANQFYSLDEAEAGGIDSQNAIRASILENQSVVNGANVRMRLETDVFINGTLIPKSSELAGKATLSGERLEVKVTAIRYRSSLFPVALTMYDIDGMEGIYIPGAISREVAKSSGESSLQNIGLSSVDQSLGVQAASAGIEAAKGFCRVRSSWSG